MLLLVAGCPATGKTTFVHENWPNDTIIEFDEWVTAYYGLPFVAAMDKYVAEFPESQHKYFNEIGKLYTQKKDLLYVIRLHIEKIDWIFCVTWMRNLTFLQMK